MKSFSEFMQTQGTSTLKEGYTKPSFYASAKVPKFTATVKSDETLEALSDQVKHIATLVHDKNFNVYMTELGKNKDDEGTGANLYKKYLDLVASLNKFVADVL